MQPVDYHPCELRLDYPVFATDGAFMITLVMFPRAVAFGTMRAFGTGVNLEFFKQLLFLRSLL